jgi:hypothetical protein
VPEDDEIGAMKPLAASAAKTVGVRGAESKLFQSLLENDCMFVDCSGTSPGMAEGGII